MASHFKQACRAAFERVLPSAARRRAFKKTDQAFAKGAPSHAAIPDGLEAELFLLNRFIGSGAPFEGKAFIDVGANAGEYAHVASRYLPPEKIWAFEPQSGYASRLRRLFPRVHVVQAALSDHSGHASLKVPLIKGAEYRTRGTLEHFSEPGESGAMTEDVQLMTFDEVRRGSVSAGTTTGIIGPVGCIKIDVEGHEKAVLAGMQETLSKDKPVLIIEIEQRHHAQPIRSIFGWLAERGYDGYFYDRQAKAFKAAVGADLAKLQDPALFKTPRYIQNFVFVPRSSGASLI